MIFEITSRDYNHQLIILKGSDNPLLNYKEVSNIILQPISTMESLISIYSPSCNDAFIKFVGSANSLNLVAVDFINKTKNLEHIQPKENQLFSDCINLLEMVQKLSQNHTGLNKKEEIIIQRQNIETR